MSLYGSKPPNSRRRCNVPERNRLKQTFESGTRTQVSNGSVLTASLRTSYEAVTDVTGPGDNEPFSVTKVMQSGGGISGRGTHYGTTYEWDGYPAEFYRTNPYAYAHLAISGRPNNTFLATELVRKTNPNRSEMDGLVSLIELREIPMLIKDSYKSGMDKLEKHLPHRFWKNLPAIAQANLLVRFGILPLLGDLDTCMKFQSLVNKRVKELDRLRSKGLRKTRKLWSGSDMVSSGSTIIHGNGATISAKLFKQSTIEINGHIRWFYGPHGVLTANESTRALASRIVRGGRVDYRTVWELMPWSWLADYFLNIGSYLEATSNQLDVTHTIPRIQTRQRTQIQGFYIPSSTVLTVSDYKCFRETKDRVLVNSGITAKVPILNNGQLSILGSLYVLKSGFGR
nr:MAG: hypothetical protein 1 [Leviviridae sp.]